MNTPIEVFNQRWEQLGQLDILRTPDQSSGKNFQITNQTDETLTITTAGGSAIEIPHIAFRETIDYLLRNNHYQGNPCQIRSNDTFSQAGPLCQVARQHTNRTRVINYIVPILAEVGILHFDGTRQPCNTTWLAEFPQN